MSDRTIKIKEQLPKWIKQIQQLSESIKFFTKSSESEFIDIGSKLQTFYEKSHEISTDSVSLADFMNGKDIIRAIKDMREMLIQMERYIKFIETEWKSNVETLEKIQKYLDLVNRPLHEFPRIIRTLQILGVYTKIASANLSSDNKNFNTLSDEVRNLVINIEDKINSIINDSVPLRNNIEQAVNKIHQLKSKQFTQAQQIINEIQGHLSVLVEKQNQFSHTGSESAKKSQQITEHIGKIVSSLQFHDMMRQKLEHVCKHLEDLRSEYIALTENNSHFVDEQINRIGETGEICGLQIAQLQFTNNELVKAMKDLFESLQGISGQITAISADNQNLTLISKDDEKDFLSNIKSGINKITASITENINITLQLTDTISTTSEKVSSMTGYAEQIDRIGVEIELIALNGLVKATQIGTEGAALGVLAEATQQLSVDANDKIKSVSEQLIEIIKISDELNLRKTSEDKKGNIEKILQSLGDDLEGLLYAFNEMSATVSERMNAINTKSLDLSGMIDETISNIKIEEEFRSQINFFITILEKLLDSIILVTPDVDREKIYQKMKNFADDYTMQSEREIHKIYTNKDSNEVIVDNNEDDIIFDNESNNDFGDNVELF